MMLLFSDACLRRIRCDGWSGVCSLEYPYHYWTLISIERGAIIVSIESEDTESRVLCHNLEMISFDELELHG